MLVTVHFRLDGQLLGETKTGAVPDIGQRVTLEHGLRGRQIYRVVSVNHQYTDSQLRRVDQFVPAPIIVDVVQDG